MNYTKGEWRSVPVDWSRRKQTYDIHVDTQLLCQAIVNKADADLIAAAPEMYDVLLTIATAYPGMQKRHKATWWKLQHAIAKAEGKA